jgi:integrase
VSTVSLAKLKSKAARAGLASDDIYWAFVGPSLYLGYRRGKKRSSWYGRLGTTVRQIALADDHLPADGSRVFDFAQASERLKQQFAAEPGNGSRAVVTVADAFDISYAPRYAMSGKHPGSRAYYRAQLGPLLDIKLAKLTREDIEAWRQKLVETPPRKRICEGEEQTYRDMANTDEARRKRRATVNQVTSVLKAALNAAFQDGHVMSNRAWGTVKKLKGTRKPEPAFLRSDAEVRHFINACDEPSGFRTLFLAGLLTGARVSELARLNVSDYHADTRTLSIQISKTDQARAVPLTSEAEEFFAALAAGRPLNEPLLPKWVRGEPRRWYTSAQGRYVTQARQSANVDPRITFHAATRHTFVSHALMRGMAKEAIAHVVGHQNTRMIEDVYGHITPSFVRQQLDQSAPRFGIKPPTNVQPLKRRK